MGSVIEKAYLTGGEFIMCYCTLKGLIEMTQATGPLAFRDQCSRIHAEVLSLLCE